MDKIHIYIIEYTGQASLYGIGTYIDELIDILDEKLYKIVRITLNVTPDIKIPQIRKCSYIQIPWITTNRSEIDKYYSRSVAFFLKSIIPNSQKIVFHFNYLADEYLAYWIKELFPSCLTVLTVHYNEWSIKYKGDLNEFIKNRNQNTNDNKDITELEIEVSKRMMKYCDKIICASLNSRNILRKIYHIAPLKIHFIPHALKDSHMPKLIYQAQKKYKQLLEKNYKIILFVGRIQERKGIIELIKAFKIVEKKYPHVILVIAGSGRYDLVTSNPDYVWTKTYFTGMLNHHELDLLYSIADIGVFCSYYEEFGYVAVEMMMHNLPIIATRTSGINEIIQNGYNGLLIPFRKKNGVKTISERVLAKNINFLLSNINHAKCLAKNGRITYLKKYNKQTYKLKMDSIYIE